MKLVEILMYIIMILCVVTLGLMLKCKKEGYEEDKYPDLIYNTQPMLPPGAMYGVNWFPPTNNGVATYPVVPIDGTMATVNPEYIAGPITWNIDV